MEIIATLVALVLAIVAWNWHRKQKRRRHLMGKYSDQRIVDMIMARRVWQGMTEAQLLDSWGRPAARENKLYKTKSSEILKYNQTGKNRFRSRVKIENGLVVGWDQK